ncbi:methyltransferase domain-containing protein [Patescibacteria group bacterium]|nr:methyltransferase domain-containing protein [Patescibacteria group bacterium]MBU4022881.1 methyltransferase domain-containing protein [Patescibacteria group bacterium]MBU4078109.1 methyltransferase domain-containing protein [Patescibacteria group bacterium]
MSNFFNRVGPYYNIIPVLLRSNYSFIGKEMVLNKGEKVLDVGGGTGKVAKEIVDLFDAEVTILDSCESMLKRVKNHPCINIIRGDIEKNALKDKSFDVILCIDTLHHLSNPKLGLEQMYRILKPGGTIFIQDFDITKIRTRILNFIEEYFLGEPANFYSPQELGKLLKGVGFNGSSKPILCIQYFYIGKKYE